MKRKGTLRTILAMTALLLLIAAKGTMADTIRISDNTMGTDHDGNTYYYGAHSMSFELFEGCHLLSLDIKSALSSISSDEGNFAFLDTFYATLYFNEPTLDEVYLFDLDYNGFTVHGGAFTPLSDGWESYTILFSVPQSVSAIPTFELFDLNNRVGDSSVYLRNIQIRESAPVPEPSTLLLLASGLAGVGIKRFRKARKRK